MNPKSLRALDKLALPAQTSIHTNSEIGIPRLAGISSHCTGLIKSLAPTEITSVALRIGERGLGLFGLGSYALLEPRAGRELISPARYSQALVHCCIEWSPPQTVLLDRTFPQQWKPLEHLFPVGVFLELQPEAELKKMQHDFPFDNVYAHP